MTKVLVLYYSSYGHIETMASAVADGARGAGARVAIRRVPELVPEAVAEKSGYKGDQSAPVATVAELADYDAIIIGTPTRFGNMAAPVKHWFDGLTAEWTSGTMVGKPAATFTSTATMHGGQEATLLSMHVPLALSHRAAQLTPLPAPGFGSVGRQPPQLLVLLVVFTSQPLLASPSQSA